MHSIDTPATTSPQPLKPSEGSSLIWPPSQTTFADCRHTHPPPHTHHCAKLPRDGRESLLCCGVSGWGRGTGGNPSPTACLCLTHIPSQWSQSFKAHGVSRHPLAISALLHTTCRTPTLSLTLESPHITGQEATDTQGLPHHPHRASEPTPWETCRQPPPKSTCFFVSMVTFQGQGVAQAEEPPSVARDETKGSWQLLPGRVANETVGGGHTHHTRCVNTLQGTRGLTIRVLGGTQTQDLQPRKHLFSRSEHFKTSYLAPCQEHCCYEGHQILKVQAFEITPEQHKDKPSPLDTTPTAAGTQRLPGRLTHLHRLGWWLRPHQSQEVTRVRHC